jgi:hypothetical protein
MLKIDVEGAEAEILRVTSENALARVHRLAIEVHSPAARAELEPLLASRGFRTAWRPSAVWPHLGLLTARRPA